MTKALATFLLLSLSLAVSLRGDSLREALQSHRYADAVVFADALLKTMPNDPRIWTARGMSLAALGRDSEGLSSFERALTLNPQFAPALKGAAESAYRARDRRARGLLDQLLHIEPQNDVAHAMAATLNAEEGDCRSAISHFEQSLSQIASNEQASSLYASCLLSEDRPEDAVHILKPLTLKVHPLASTWSLLAAAENASGHLDEAVPFYKKAIETAPENEQNYIDFAAFYIHQDATASALPIVDLGLTHSPKSARLHAMRGVIQGQIGVESEAIAEFELANRLDPKAEYGAPGLGVLYTASSQTELASDVLRERLKKAPEDPTLNYLLAEALIRQDVQPDTPAFAEASSALRRAIRVKPEFAGAHIALGKLYNRTGDYSNAVTELKAGLERSHSDRAALSQLAAALRHLGRTDEAAAVSRTLRDVVMSDVRKRSGDHPPLQIENRSK